VRLPTALRGARVQGPRAAAFGLVLVVLVAALGFGVRVAWARSTSTPQVVAPGPSGSALATRGAAHAALASSPTASGGGGPPAQVTVHVVGEVRTAGVLTLPQGSRVADAVANAGGARPGADLGTVNLARLLVDGEQVRIPKPGEVLAPQAVASGGVGGASTGLGGGAGSAGSVAGSAGGAAGGGAAGAGRLVNLNTATASEFETLPGVGPVLAGRIVDWRTEHGRFASVDELAEVSGIGEKIFAQLQPKVTV
jgi:competence protein ComEA